MWDVVGQDRAVFLLQSSLKAGALSHAYLLTGPPHVGKMTLALDLARALNCEGEEPPCGKCGPCQRIAAGKHSDAVVTSLAANGNDEDTDRESRVKIGVGQIDMILHSVSLPPFEGRCKVFVLDGAEFLSTGAANRLLKTLEEPVSEVVFVLLTANEGMVPSTVVSRCQRIELRPMGNRSMEEVLVARWGLEPGRARLLSRLANGCPGWAISATSDESIMRRREEWLDEVVALASANYEERFAFAAQLAASFSQDRGAVQDKLGVWLGWWRDLLVVKTGCSDAVVNVDRETGLEEMARDYGLAQVRAFIDDIRAAGERLSANASPLLVLEVLMLSIPDGKGTASPATRWG